jgi:hypothetical protein
VWTRSGGGASLGGWHHWLDLTAPVASGLDSERRSRSPRQDRRNEELCARQGRQPAQWWRVREPRETGPPTRQVGARSRPWLASGCSVTFLAVGFPFPGSRVFSVVDGWRITGSAALLAFLVCLFRGGWRRSLVIAWIGWRPARYGGCGLGLRLARVRAQSVAPPPTTLHVRCGERESFLLPPLGRTGNVPAHDRCSSRSVTTGAPAREGGRHTSFSRAVRLVGTVLAPARGERRPSRPVPAPTHGMGMAAHREGQTGTERGLRLPARISVRCTRLRSGTTYGPFGHSSFGHRLTATRCRTVRSPAPG